MIEIDITYLNQLVIDFFNQFSGLSAFEIIWLLLFKYWGWLIFIFIFLRFFVYPEYMFYIQIKWAGKMPKPIILAIDVPKRNEQSIQAVENFFDQLLGAHATLIWWTKYIEGEFQRSMSVELISYEGNIQFLVRCPSDWRNLVEASVYGQFPDAEITEVEDYVNSVPKLYPNETHDLWGCEFTLSNKNVYLPIKTYPKFEHRFSETFVDPIAALLETMSSIGKGEQIWLQITLTPLAVDWGLEGGKKEINKILQIKPKTKKGVLSQIFSPFTELVSEFTEQLVGMNLSGEGAVEEKKPEPLSVMMHLSPGQKEQLEAIENKISKLAFNTKVRYIYVAEKDKMNKPLGVNAVIGAIKQWSDMNLNGFKPDLKATGTSSPQYILIDYRRNARKNKIMSAYRNRSVVVGSPAKPLCAEELASIWHFPSMYVKAPLLKKTEFKKAAAPFGLPLQEAPLSAIQAKKAEAELEEKSRVMPSFDYDNDEFEMQFAKDKEAFIKSRSAREKRLQEIAREEEQKLKIQKEKQEALEKIEAKDLPKKEIKGDKEEKEKKPFLENLPFID